MVLENNFQVGKWALFWGYISQFFQYGTALIILPVILNKLPADDMAVWYIFMSISSIVGLVDFGFSPSISKQVSFVYSGVNVLSKDGIAENGKKLSDGVNLSILNDLYRTCISLYRKIAIIIGLVLLLLGTLYLFYVVDDIDYTIIGSWLVFIVSSVYSFYYNYILVFIRGRGLIKENNKLIIISKGVQIVVLYVCLILGWGLLSLVISNFLSTFVMRVLGRKMMIEPEFLANIKKHTEYNDLTGIIWYNAKRYGITSLGVFLSGIFLSLNEVSELGLTIQLFTILTVVARVPLSSYISKISSLFVDDNILQIRRYFVLCQSLCYVIYFLGSGVILLSGNWILREIINSKTLLPDITVLTLYFFFYLMEVTHGNCVTLISAENKVIYYRAAIVSGFMSVTSTLLFLCFGLGIYSFPLGLIMGSLPYNSWRWPYYVYNRLKIK